MKLNIRKKLAIGIFLLSFFILAIIAGILVVMKFYKSTTEKLIVEYHEGQALQTLKISLSNLLQSANQMNEVIDATNLLEFKNELDTCFKNFNKCEKALTEIHNLEKMLDAENTLKSLKVDIDSIIKHGTRTKMHSFKVYIPILEEGIKQINALTDEINEEIALYEDKSKKAIRHGTMTVISFGIIVIILLLVGGILYIGKLTRPISELVHATNRIGSGDLVYRIKLQSEDEFQVLADSFNKMLDTLNKTSISKEYFKGIIDNLFGALFVTDNQGFIRFSNKASKQLLGYDETELIGQHINIFFDDDPKEIFNKFKDSKLDEIATLLKNKNLMFAKKGNSIPVLITCTRLKNHSNMQEGLIIVGHDLTEKMAFEKQIDQIRKETQKAIYEAQENERMRIATDIHDGLGQMLTAVHYSLQEFKEKCGTNINQVMKIQTQLQSAMQETKTLAHNLIPIVLKDFGLLVAIKNIIERANQLNEIKFSFSHYDFDERLDPRLEKTIYRICQEATNNVFKHSKAKNCNIQLFKSDENVVLVIDDDGIGFNVDHLMNKKSKGIGLLSIRERVNSFNGIFTIDSEVNKGTELIIEIPQSK